MRVKSIRRTGQTFAPSPVEPETGILPASLSEREAARYIGMSAAWLKKSRTRRFRAIADAPRYVRAGTRRIVYRRVDLDDWQMGHTIAVGYDPAKVPSSLRPNVPNGRLT